MIKSPSRRHLAGLSVLASFTFISCQPDRSPTAVQPTRGVHAEQAAAAPLVNAYGLAYASPHDPHVCFTSVATGGTPAFRYGRISLHFPTPALAPDGVTHLYVYGGRNSSGGVAFVAECAIPATRIAVELMNRRFGVVDLDGNPPAIGHPPRQAGGISTMGCVVDGECALEPITVTVSPLPVDNCNVMGCGTEGGGTGGGNTGSGGGGTMGSTSGPGSPIPDDSTEVDAGSCPSTLRRMVTALIAVGGSNHQFDFEGPLYKISAASPARYNINPTVSKDGQWMATEGWIEVNCFGAYGPSIGGGRVWAGAAWFTGNSDLHMIYGPQHPSF